MKTQSITSVKAIFKRHFKGMPNIFTPETVKFGYVPRYFDRSLVWELSKGEGMYRQDIFGITVLEINNAGDVIKHRHDLSQGGHFKTEKEALAYVKTLRTIDLGKAGFYEQ